MSDIYPRFIEPTITWVPSGFSGYIWLDTKIVLKKKPGSSYSQAVFYWLGILPLSSIWMRLFEFVLDCVRSDTVSVSPNQIIIIIIIML